MNDGHGDSVVIIHNSLLHLLRDIKLLCSSQHCLSSYRYISNLGIKLRNKWGKNKALFKVAFYCLGVWEGLLSTLAFERRNLAIILFRVIFIKRMKKNGSHSATRVSEQQIEGPPKTLIPIFEVQFQSPRLEKPFQNEGHKCICDLDDLSGRCQGNNWRLLNRTAEFLSVPLFPFVLVVAKC